MSTHRPERRPRGRFQVHAGRRVKAVEQMLLDLADWPAAEARRAREDLRRADEALRRALESDPNRCRGKTCPFAGIIHYHGPSFTIDLSPDAPAEAHLDVVPIEDVGVQPSRLGAVPVDAYAIGNDGADGGPRGLGCWLGEEQARATGLPVDEAPALELQKGTPGRPGGGSG